MGPMLISESSKLKGRQCTGVRWSTTEGFAAEPSQSEHTVPSRSAS